MAKAWIMRFDGQDDIMYLAKNNEIVHNINAAHLYTVKWHADRRIREHSDILLRAAFRKAYPNEGIVLTYKIKASIVPVELIVRQINE